MKNQNKGNRSEPSDWDHSSSREFFEYYAKQSATPEAIARAERARDMILRVRGNDMSAESLSVLDIGCNAGTFSIAWAKQGHDVIGVDISAELLQLANERASEAGLSIDFKLGSATKLPISSSSIDVCMSPELLEHVVDWESCLDEFARVLRPGGTLYLTTTNKLCPSQMEFNLPLYSWYPQFAKKYYEKLAVTTKPALANYATYPAVNWFSFYELKKELVHRGLSSMDRFDVMNQDSLPKKVVVFLVKHIAVIRLLGQVCTPSSIVVATKQELKSGA